MCAERALNKPSQTDNFNSKFEPAGGDRRPSVARVPEELYRLITLFINTNDSEQAERAAYLKKIKMLVQDLPEGMLPAVVIKKLAVHDDVKALEKALPRQKHRPPASKKDYSDYLEKGPAEL